MDTLQGITILIALFIFLILTIKQNTITRFLVKLGRWAKSELGETWSLKRKDQVEPDLLPEVETVETEAQAVFTAVYPREVTPQNRFHFLIYAHTVRYSDRIIEDSQRFELGKKRKKNEADQLVDLELGTKITVLVECDKIEFEPESLTKKWHGDWTRFEFEFRPTADLIDKTLFIRISIQVAGIEIAHIQAAIEIVATEETSKNISSPPPHQVSATNPLLESKMRSQTATPYQRIFISYSRRDSSVAKSYKTAQTMLGNDAFLDVDNLRTGEDWRAALARAIDEADIFQLFWSEHSANSEYCRYEWDYALTVRCPDNICEGFIRPVYWRTPMPSPPPELSCINFRFVPFEDQDD